MSLIRDRLPSRRGVKNVCCLGEKEEVSEMLKKIREKASTPKALNPRRK